MNTLAHNLKDFIDITIKQSSLYLRPMTQEQLKDLRDRVLVLRRFL